MHIYIQLTTCHVYALLEKNNFLQPEGEWFDVFLNIYTKLGVNRELCLTSSIRNHYVYNQGQFIQNIYVYSVEKYQHLYPRSDSFKQQVQSNLMRLYTL